MKLDEITLVPDISEHGVNQFNHESKQIVGKLSDFDVCMYHTNDPNAVLLTAETGDKISARILLQQNIRIHNEDYIMSRRTWTEPEFRGKGLSMRLLVFARTYFNTKIISDLKHTEDGKRLWDSLKKRYKVTGLNVDTGERIENISDEQTYKKDSNDPENRFFLVLETTNNPLQQCLDINGAPSMSSDILTPIG